MIFFVRYVHYGVGPCQEVVDGQKRGASLLAVGVMEEDRGQGGKRRRRRRRTEAVAALLYNEV